jgi:hypothetical protein
MSRARVLAASFTLSFAGLLSPSLARGDVQACLNAAEKGQKAQKAGKLREARDQFLICGADSCPSLVRHDCNHWNGDIANALPTVVFGARDKQGRDLFDVTVSMDGEVLVKKLDGKSVTVDPGKHTFRFELSGLPAVTEPVVIKEGERSRSIAVTFDSPTPPPTPPVPTATATPATSSTTDGDKNNPPPKEEGHTPYPWIVVGLGLVAVVAGGAIYLTSPGRPGNCSAVTKTCQKYPSTESDAQFAQDRQKAGTADSQPVLGFGIAGVGAAITLAGLLWHFLEPTGDAKAPASQSTLRFSPWATAHSQGVAALGTF